MSSIGLKNFRRFQNMDPIELGGVNFFVGGNNAGKSTVVKAMLLVADFLKNSKVTSLADRLIFKFDGIGAHDVNIDTFSRAFCWNTTESEITFNVGLDDFTFDICLINGSESELSYADVKYVKLFHKPTSVTIDFLFDQGKCHINIPETSSFKEERKVLEFDIKVMKQEVEKLGSRFVNATTEYDDSDITEFFSELSKLNVEIKEKEGILTALRNADGNKGLDETIDLFLDIATVGGNYISSYIHGINSYAVASENKTLNEYSKTFKTIADAFDKAAYKINLEYIYAHSASQQVLFNKKDQNDYVSKSIHEFYNQRIVYNTELGKIFLKWINDFTGQEFDSYEVKAVQGEAYRFVLHPKAWAKKREGVNLADMGRGTIQLVILFIRLATIIKRYKSRIDKPVVLVEEPEQNLHPAVQSKLAKLFLDIYIEEQIRFIIETHSEYIVRNVQVLFSCGLKKSEYTVEANPFAVYYFDAEEGPLLMSFKPNGRFNREFGTGFYDVATDLSFDLLDLEEE